MKLLIMHYFGAVLSSFAVCFAFDWVNQEISFLRRSQCDHCGHTLKFWDLMPILSQIYLKFRCRYCQEHISWLFLLSEIIGGCVFVWLNLLFPHNNLIVNLGLFLTLSLMVYADIWAYMVPDLLQLALFVFLLLSIDKLPVIIDFNPLFVFFIFLVMSTLCIIFPFALGGADIKAIVIIACFLPFEVFPNFLFLASTSGLLYFILLANIRHRKVSYLPFIPFLLFSLLLTYTLLVIT